MTRQKLPDLCNFCAKAIESAKQYTLEVFDGRSTWFNAKDERTKAKAKLDMCQACFLEVCKNGFIPSWITEIKNPNYVAGSKDANKKYTLEKPQPIVQEKITA